MNTDHVNLEHAIPVHKSVRRLRGFRASFDEQIKNTSAQTGIRYKIQDDKLTEAFVEWLDAFEAQKPMQDSDNVPYVGFAAGLMLRSLIVHDPADATHVPQTIDKNSPIGFWPEGYLYVAYCINMRGCVLEQDFHTHLEEADVLNDLQTWWSFRENVATDPSLAIAFLDLFSGQEPNWFMPSLFKSTRYRAVTRKTFQQLQHQTSKSKQ